MSEKMGLYTPFYSGTCFWEAPAWPSSRCGDTDEWQHEQREHWPPPPGLELRVVTVGTLERLETRSRAGQGVVWILRWGFCLRWGNSWRLDCRQVSSSWFNRSVWPLDWGWYPEERLMVAPRREQKAFRNRRLTVAPGKSLGKSWRWYEKIMQHGLHWPLAGGSSGSRMKWTILENLSTTANAPRQLEGAMLAGGLESQVWIKQAGKGIRVKR